MTTPDFGRTPKKRLSRNKKIGLFAIGTLGGVAVFILYRRHAANAAAASSTDTTGTNDPNAVYTDPNTGQSYGLGAGGVAGPYIPGTQYATNNATWAQASEGYLTAQGFDPATVATALGLYLAGLPLTQDQYNIVQAALGAEGQPPNGAPPAQLIGGGGGGQGGGGGGTGGGGGGGTGGGGGGGGGTGGGGGGKPGVKVAVPNIIGMRQVAAGVIVRSKGLRFNPQHQGVGIGTLSWTVISQQPPAGTKVKIGSTVTADEKPAGVNIPARRR